MTEALASEPHSATPTPTLNVPEGFKPRDMGGGIAELTPLHKTAQNSLTSRRAS